MSISGGRKRPRMKTPAGSRPCRIRVGSSGLAFPHPLRLKKEAQNAVAAIRSIPPYPDVPPGLKKMKDAGFRMYTLTNSPGQVMESQVKNAGIAQYFDGLLTVDGLNVYKPHPRTYHWAAHQSNVPIQNCMLIAAHGWDVAGARLAGMRAAVVESRIEGPHPYSAQRCPLCQGCTS